MSNHVPGKFTVEDCTYKRMRYQSEILEGVDTSGSADEEVEAPSSLTPEQITDFLMNLIKGTGDQSKRRVYAQLIKWTKENSELKAQLRRYQLKELKEMSSKETPDDIVE